MEREPADNPTLISIAQAARVVDALNKAAITEGTGPAKVAALLVELQGLLGYDADLEAILYDDLDRTPAPQIAERVCVGPTMRRLEPRDHATVQAAVDAGAGMWEQLRTELRKRSPAPSVVVYSQDNDGTGWFERLRDGFLVPHGWVDILCAAWIDRRDRLVQFIAVRTQDQRPFEAVDRELMQLMVCAVAPLIDREMFKDEKPEAFNGLSPRQTDVLRHLLTGMSEKEVARALHRSTETVHNHVRAIYQNYDVNSRGELMARFIDRRVLEGV